MLFQTPHDAGASDVLHRVPNLAAVVPDPRRDKVNMFPRDVSVLEHDEGLVAVAEAPQVFSGDRSEAVVGEWLIGARVDRGVKDDVFRPRTTRDVGRHLPENTFGRQPSVCRKLPGQENVGLIPIDFSEVVRERFHQVFGGRRNLRNHRSISCRRLSVKATTRSCNRRMSAA
nr:hypothetical protein [Tannerella forsythia]